MFCDQIVHVYTLLRRLLTVTTTIDDRRKRSRLAASSKMLTPLDVGKVTRKE